MTFVNDHYSVGVLVLCHFQRNHFLSPYVPHCCSLLLGLFIVNSSNTIHSLSMKCQVHPAQKEPTLAPSRKQRLASQEHRHCSVGSFLAQGRNHFVHYTCQFVSLLCCYLLGSFRGRQEDRIICALHFQTKFVARN